MGQFRTGVNDRDHGLFDRVTVQNSGSIISADRRKEAEADEEEVTSAGSDACEDILSGWEGVQTNILKYGKINKKTNAIQICFI